MKIKNRINVQIPGKTKTNKAEFRKIYIESE